jgi:uncharacterized membrane protein YkvA (DUF1232 family)
MDSKGVRRLINDGLEHEQRTGSVREMLAGKGLTPEQQNEMLGFIKSYVAEAPELIEAAYHGAASAGILDSVKPLFEAAFKYWATEHDFIPNHMGLVGITDDAYLSRTLMSHVSDAHFKRFGRPLFSLNLEPANQAMRKVIGEPVATRLDDAVRRTLNEPGIQTVLQGLSGFGSVDMGLPNYGGYLEHAAIESGVDVKLGSIGLN